MGLVQKNPDKSPLYKFCLNCSRGLCPGFFRGLLSGRLCPGWFLSVPLLSEYICYNRKLSITLNFMFHMYDKNIYKCDVTCSLAPSPCHKLSHLLGPLGPSSVTYFMDGIQSKSFRSSLQNSSNLIKKTNHLLLQTTVIIYEVFVEETGE